MTLKYNATTKILVLYLISMILFLAVALSVIYSLQTDVIFDDEAKRIYDARGAISFVLRHRDRNKDNLEAISQSFDISFAVFVRDGLLFSNLKYMQLSYLPIADVHAPQKPSQMDNSIERIPFSLPQFSMSDLGQITLINGRAYLFDMWQKRPTRGKIEHVHDFIIIEGSDLTEAFFRLKVHYFFLSFFIIIVVGLIAFFLVRISLTPMQKHIQFLNDFLKDSTHEINTPLSIIMMSIERFKADELGDRNKKLLNNILIASRTLSHVYDDLVYLNFARTIPNQNSSVDLASLIYERLEYFTPHIAQKQLCVDCHVHTLMLYANPYKITKILDNLLSNAIKYNQHQGILHLALRDTHFSIKNSGSIDKALIQRIFERYARANTNQGGFGLGLYLVQQICLEYQLDIVLNTQQEDDATIGGLIEVIIDFKNLCE